MLPLIWSTIRPLNGSQQEGFEELVCQLAGYEFVPADSKFRRKGKPDGGVECYWTFPDGSEWGWQAKYFITSPTSSQWGQVDKSVKRFLKTHPAISRFTIAMPIDFSDARSPGQKTAKQKWDEHVDKWRDWANKQGQPVDFEYWGVHKLLDRLSQDMHRGRVFFWFQREFFDQRWFTQRIEESIADVGVRYTPELDVALPIAHVFDGLGRTNAFYKRLKEWVARIRKDTPSGNRIGERSSKIYEALSELNEDVNTLCQTLVEIDSESMVPIDWRNVTLLIEATQTQIRLCDKVVAKEGDCIRADKKLQESSPQYLPKPDEWVKCIRYDLRRLGDVLSDCQRFVESEESHLANTGALLLVGEAGKGKTHMFCDVARQRNTAQLPTILLLGEHFIGDVWPQILELLDLAGHTRGELLGALESAAQVRGRKALILIDALNESANLTMWHSRLRSFLKVITRYEWIAVAISVRSLYVDLVIPDNVSEDQLVRVEHRGFEDVEYEATRHFFDYYGIVQPSVPLLHPEFQTPMFLKIFCEALKNEEIHHSPNGLHGITAIFDFFVSSIYKRLQSPDRLNLSPHSDVVRRVIDRVTMIMAERKTPWLPIAETEKLVNDDLPPSGYTESLFYNLCSEGLLTKGRFPIEDGSLAEGVSFSYQRLTDHLIAQHLLNHYLTSDPTEAFKEDTPLHKLVMSRDGWWQPQARGLIEAISIQLPERIGQELMVLVPAVADNWYINRAFVESVLWRDPHAISDETLKCINQCIQDEDLHDRVLNVLLTVAVDPVHPYNADFLHRRLMKNEMAERDAWWSIFLYEQYGQKMAVDRLVDWAWASNDKSRIEDESIRLCGMTLAWFLTTSHRFIRDRATKALVNILSDRSHVLRNLLTQFREVNDPYVLERLMAVTYGCVMRSDDDEQIRLLAQDVFDWLFVNNHPPEHILLRDYARGVVEYALSRGFTVIGDVEKIRPPYESNWVEIPTKEEIDALEFSDGTWDSTDGSWAHNRIIRSVMNDDFAWYVIGTNRGGSDWLSLRLDDPLWMSAEDELEKFVTALSAKQKEAWDLYETAQHALSARKRPNILEKVSSHMDESSEIIEGPLNDSGDQDDNLQAQLTSQQPENGQIEKLEQQVASTEEHLSRLLDDRKLLSFEERVKPIVKSVRMPDDGPRFDLSKIQHWIVKRVFDMGWTIDRFGFFDRYQVGYDGRDARKPERIGKKYQWIAYHEILARLADNFQFLEKYGGHADGRVYNGSWQLGIRDIDPSDILKTKPTNDSILPWWIPGTYDHWEVSDDDVAWVKSDDDFPDATAFINVVNHRDNSHWLTLNSYYVWEQPESPEQNHYEIARRHVWSLLFGYLVHKQNVDQVSVWAMNQDFFGRWMPEGQEFHESYLGELYWSPAYKYLEDPYMGDYGWQIPRRLDSQCPGPLMPLWASYQVEYGGFDCSIDESFSISMPSKLLADEMEIHWKGSGGGFVGKSGELLAFDPSTIQPGPSVLLVKAESFQSFLEAHNYDVLWISLGGKNLIGGGIGTNEWKGETIMNGVYRITEGEIVGKHHSEYRHSA